MQYLIWLAVLVTVILLWRFFTSARFRSKRRSIEFGPDGFISLWPNPGIQIGTFHWCKARGFHEGWRPNKLGLNPKKKIDEGEPGYEARIKFLENLGKDK